MVEVRTPKVVFLDWAGTLSASAFWAGWRGSAGGEWQTIQSRLFGDQQLVQAWMRGRLTAEDVVAHLLAGNDQEGERWLGELERSCREMTLTDESLWRIVPTIRAMGIRVVIATDNMDTFPRWTVPALGLTDFADDILDSWTLGVLKEDVDEAGRSAFFYPWLVANGINATEAVLFDDGHLGARTSGVQWIQIGPTRPLAAALTDWCMGLSSRSKHPRVRQISC